jgi:hypothetical protein
MDYIIECRLSHEYLHRAVTEGYIPPEFVFDVFNYPDSMVLFAYSFSSDYEFPADAVRTAVLNASQEAMKETSAPFQAEFAGAEARSGSLDIIVWATSILTSVDPSHVADIAQGALHGAGVGHGVLLGSLGGWLLEGATKKVGESMMGKLWPRLEAMFPWPSRPRPLVQDLEQRAQAEARAIADRRGGQFAAEQGGLRVSKGYVYLYRLGEPQPGFVYAIVDPRPYIPVEVYETPIGFIPPRLR